jgi:hypothetical protein
MWPRWTGTDKKLNLLTARVAAMKEVKGVVS